MRAPPVDEPLLDLRYRVETPEGIALTLAPAGVVARSVAFAIDFSIRVALLMTVAVALGLLGQFGFGLFMIFFFGLEWFYPVLFELSPWAATPGKRALGLKVVMDDGLPVTPAASLIRNLLRAADFLPFLYAAGLISMLVRADFKRLGDLAADTIVVHVADPSHAEPATHATPRPPERPLSTRAQAALLAWAARIPRLTPARAEELAAIAAPAVVPRAREDQQVEALAGVARWLAGHR